MNNMFLVIIVAVVFVFTINYFAFAVFQQPTLPPPDGNVPAPVNVGPGYQVKSGDLAVNNFIANAISLGGITRLSWPTGTGAACTWEGVRCSCRDDSSTFADLALIVGLTCNSGRVTNFEIIDMQISSSSKNCSSNPPPGCTAGLYTFE